MDNQPRSADDRPDLADLSGPLREAVEAIRREEVPEAARIRVLERAKLVTELVGRNQRSAVPAPSTPSQSIPSTPPTQRKSRMIAIAMRVVTAAVAASALIGAWLYSHVATTEAADLGAVLAKTSAAATLELKLTRDGQTGAVQVSGRNLRWDRPDGTYQIARDRREWSVDEKENRAMSRPSSLFGDAGGVDFVALLGLSLDDKQKELLAAKPAERATRDGGEVEVYRWETAGPNGTLRIEAAADAKSGLLQSIEALRVRGERTEPICRLAVVARDKPVDEELFVVGDTLTEDGRIGKVTDVQGLVTVRPTTNERWTPVTERMPLRPGDWLQTDPRGANAVSVRLVKETDVVVGPGSTVELASPRQLRISAGEIKIKAAAKSPVELIGPSGEKLSVEGTQVFHADQKLVRLDKDPPWLRSYEGKAVGDSIGSLVTKIDGRNVPLTVGYHKVVVDIRDQIARTTIEESFVNHTAAQLEGTFHFPLPQDASIAGFGMWIGDNLVEADVVEKQRAREIYETILRERRDPGLLEWSGGNIFKARVFPILPHSEKRITITYTQVLPWRGAAFRYQYALQSDLLKQHPLRQLEIDVKVSSATPLKAVNSPTHLTRNSLTAHSARVEFSAKEYTPAQDFEVVVEVAGQQSDVVLIPHCRGEDGYFLVQLTPSGVGFQPASSGVGTVVARSPDRATEDDRRSPDAPGRPAVEDSGGVGRPAPNMGVGRPAPNSGEGQLHREILPDGDPLELLILADTSASMDAPSRRRQAELVAALLASLTPKDKFNLATCDADCQWAFAKPAVADSKHIDLARQQLAARRSLGWTDLDKAIQAAVSQCGPKTHVVYIGDGIVTTGDGDPVACTKRLRRMAEGKLGTFHAVAVSSSFEPAVLRAIASVGGGSFRQVSGSQGPASVAMELLGEITQPALRDLKVEFRGLRTVRVYPEPLPNLPLGTQQILLGRYLPDGKDQTGEVIVTGTQAGKPVRFTGTVSLKDAEQGNSFIPRLWARMHLDALLEQGASQAIKDEIIALSEEYHIITPYTSLLVLETDADRERFGVKRRFQMRDGEKFFAEGRDNANWELIQQQMKQAGAWRLGLRRDVLQQLNRLGRLAPGQARERGRSAGLGGGAMGGGGFGGGWDVSESTVMLGAAVQPLGELGLTDNYDVSGRWDVEVDFEAQDKAEPASGPQSSTPMLAEEPLSDGEFAEDRKKLQDAAADAPWDLGDVQQFYFQGERLEKDRAYDGLEVAGEPMAGSLSLGQRGAWSRESLAVDEGWAGNELAFSADSRSAFGLYAGKPSSRGLYSQRPGGRPDHSWLESLFAAVPEPADWQEPKKPWPPEARAVARSLLRNDALTGHANGLRIGIETESFDPRWNELTGRSRTTALVSPSGWLTESVGDGPESIAWTDGKQRGTINTAFLLGRVRPSKPADLRHPPIDLGTGTMMPLDLSYQGYLVEVKPAGKDRTLLVLKHPNSPHNESRFLIDTARQVLLKIEIVNKNKVTHTTTLDEFVEVGGAWYAGRIQATNAEGRHVSVATQKLAALAAGDFAREFPQRLAVRDRSQFLAQPLPRLVDAKKALAAGKPSFEDQIVMLLHFAATQQWDRVLAHLDAAEKLSQKPGMRWVRMAVLQQARRAEDAKKLFLAEAESLAKRSTTIKEWANGNELFLADHLFASAHSLLEANERLRLLDAVRPVYEHQPPHVRGMRRWTEGRIGLLDQISQTQEAMKLRKQLAADYPHDYAVQQQYARALAGAGEYTAAYAWLDRVLVPEAKWLDYEEEQLRTTYADLLREQGRYSDAAEYLGAWVKQNPPSQNAYAQYLSALVWSDNEKQVNELVGQWIKDGLRPGELPPDVAARLRAAISHALGQGYNLYTNHIDDRWLKPLADAALVLVRQPFQPDLRGTADQIVNHHVFRQSDEGRRVRKETLRIVLAEIDKLPAEQLQRLVNWLSPNDPVVEPEAWKQIAAGLRLRWDAESDWQAKNQLGSVLAGVLQSHVGAEAWLDFLRTQLKTAREEGRAGFALQWFDALLGQPWTQAREDEAFDLLTQTSDAEQPSQRLAAHIAALCQMTDRMVQARYQDRMKAVEHPEKLTRTELRAKQGENLRAAREGYADRLLFVGRALARRAPNGIDKDGRKVSPQGGLKPTLQTSLALWINVERLYLEVAAGRQLDKVAEECFEFLGSPRIEPADELARQLDDLLHRRYLATLMNLAARKGAKPGLADRVLARLDAGAKADPEDPRWKAFQYQLLVALDRPKELASRLEKWIAEGDDDNGWRLILGYLQAETGRLPEAIKLFEAVRAADELGPAELRTLADWYMAVSRRDAYDRARIEAFKVTDEGRLSRWLSAKLRPWQRHGGEQQPPPRELDVEVLLAFAAAFEKSSQPHYFLSQLAQFYGATRDFRLLAGLGDAVIGHTTGKVYPFLQGMSQVLAEVRDEATADSIVERVADARKRAKTDVDRRALDLLEVLVERRGSELQNQPGPHGERALAAMKRAWKREWSPGEPRLVADLLASLGGIAYEPLAAEQVRELESLHRDAARGSADRMHIGYALARTYWAYARHDPAIDLLSEALDEYQAACGGVLPVASNDALGTLVGYLENRTHHARGERLLVEQLKHPANQQQPHWLVQRLYQLYDSAIANDGEVSLGRAAELFRAVDKKLQNDLDTPDQNHRYHLVSRLCAIYRTAHGKKIPDVADAVRRFAFGRLPEVLKRQSNNYSSMVSQAASALHDIAGAKDGLAFLIRRMQNEPTWFRLNNQDGWSQHAHTLGQWRTEVKNLGELELPLLHLVTEELRRDLHSRQSRNRNMYTKHSGHFWRDKEADFASTAEEVWTQDKQSGAACQHIAEYLYHRLEHHSRAIEILFDAHRREVLEESGQSRLVDYLHRQQRFAESIPLLEPLVERRPDNLQYRVWLMHAYFKTRQPPKLAELLTKTHDHFHRENRWQENAMATLGRSCLKNEIFQQAVNHLAEAIAHRQRTAPRRGIGDGTLSGYYGDQARAYAGLKKTAEAIDAASAAVVAWGRDIHSRGQALESLKDIVRAAHDLDAYVLQLDKTAAETGQENPIVRKALGQIYLEKDQFARAAAQLRIAAEAQPNDRETHDALLACFDQQKDQAAAVEDLLRWREAVPRDIKLYEDLGKRLEKLGQASEAERAFTSIVEALPAESESHQLLAEVRQRQDRWPEAIVQWEQVARIRSLEPTGLVGLANALIHGRRPSEAAAAITKLKQTAWPARFDNPPDNLPQKTRELDERLESIRK